MYHFSMQSPLRSMQTTPRFTSLTVVATGISPSNIKMIAVHTVVLVCLTIAGFSATSNAEENCTTKLVADIYILTDGSNSINSVGWGRSLTFVSDLIKSFPVGPENVQFAYGTFSTNYVHYTNLNTYDNQDDLSKVVLSTTQLRGVTYTFDALRAIRVDGYLSSTAKGARPGVPKILIVVTDGNSDNITRTIAEADALRKEGVRIIVVSVGAVNQVECIGIAGSEENVFNVRNFAGLEAIKSQITQRVCIEPEPEPDPCPGTIAVDLVFVIDASGNLGDADYKKNFEFVVKSVRGFTLGENGARVALVTFGSSPQVIFPLTDNINFIYEKLMNVSYQGSTTNTHLALYKALELFSVENGGRNGAKKTVVLVTDGLSADPNNTRVAASTLRGFQVLIITVGVTTQANEAELTAVATKPEYIFLSPTYSVLVSFANPVTAIACNEPIPPPTVKPCPAANIVDIVFVVDSSGSIGADNYQFNFQFIQAIIDVYYIAEDGAKIALLTFGTSVRARFRLSADRAFITEELKNVPYQGSTTNTHLALNYVLDNGWLTPQYGARNGSHILILITDGQSSVPDETQAAASRVKADGITIITVGVGNYVDQDELDTVASKPEYAITAHDYSVLDYIASKTSDIACNEGQNGGR